MVGSSESCKLRSAMSTILCWGIVCSFINLVPKLNHLYAIRCKLTLFGCWLGSCVIWINLWLLGKRIHIPCSLSTCDPLFRGNQLDDGLCDMDNSKYVVNPCLTHNKPWYWLDMLCATSSFWKKLITLPCLRKKETQIPRFCHNNIFGQAKYPCQAWNIAYICMHILTRKMR